MILKTYKKKYNWNEEKACFIGFPTLITFAEINQHCFQETIIFLHVLVE